MFRVRHTSAIAAISSGARMVPVGLAGLAMITPAGAGSSPGERFGGELEARLGPAGDLHRRHVQRLQRVAVGDIARPRQRHPVAGRKAGAQGEHQGRRRAAGQDELVRQDLDAVGLAIVAGEARLQRRALPIAHAVAVQHPVRHVQGGLGRAGGGLAELHVDDGAAFGLQGVRQAADADGLEGVDLGGGHGAALA